MSRSTYLVVAAVGLASVIFVGACIFVFVAGAYRPPVAVTATPQSSASEPTGTAPAPLNPSATPPAATSTPGDATGTPNSVTGTPASPTDTPASSADPARGKVIFSAGQNQAPPCSGCHATVRVGRGFAIGPNLSGVADRAATRREGMSAEAYLTESILHPREFVVPGYRDMMYANYGEAFTSDEVADVVAYLLTLHEDPSVASQ
jgi:cytochrome c